MLILVKMNGLRTYELVGVRLGPTKNAMMQQWHAGQYKVQGDTRLILIRHCLKIEHEKCDSYICQFVQRFC